MVDRTAQSSRAMCVETTQCVQTKTTQWAFAASAQLISTTFLDLTTVWPSCEQHAFWLVDWNLSSQSQGMFCNVDNILKADNGPVPVMV